jgi:ParB family chromosome partitioning protein
VSVAVPVRLMKRDVLFVIEKLVSLMEEPRLEMLARQHGIRQKRNDGGIGKTLAAYIRRADEGTLSRLLVEISILLATSRSNPAIVLRDAASTYKVDTDAIALKVKLEFAAKEKSKKTTQSTAKAGKKRPSNDTQRGRHFADRPAFCCTKIAQGEPVLVSPLHPHPAPGLRSSGGAAER